MIDSARIPEGVAISWEKGQSVTGEVELNQDTKDLVIQSEASTESVERVLSRLARLRIKKTYDTPGTTPVSSGISEKVPIIDENGNESPTSVFIVTPTTGRAVFLPDSPSLSKYFTLPSQEKRRKPPVIGIKGLGSAYNDLSENDLTRTDHLPGFTGRTNEIDVEKKLLEGKYTVTSLDGNKLETNFNPGRYTIGNVAIEAITTVEGHTHKIADLDPKTHPLLTGDNKPEAIFHAYWTRYNFADVEFLARVFRKANKQGDSAKAGEVEREFENWTKEIYAGLREHPDFASFLNSEEMDDETTFSVPDFWAKFFVAQLNKDFQDAQILDQKHIRLEARHSQNVCFGGHKDLEGSYIDHTNKELFEYHMNESLKNLCDLYSNIFLMMTPDQRQQITTAITEEISKRKLILINQDQLMLLMEKLTSDQYGGTGEDVPLRRSIIK